MKRTFCRQQLDVEDESSETKPPRPKRFVIRRLREVLSFLAVSVFERADLVLVFAVLLLKLMIITTPSPEVGVSQCIDPPLSGCGFVFDEAHYVPAVRRLLVGEQANNEHPPLTKGLIMLGVVLFGDSPFAWRIFIIISSAVSVGLLHRLALELTGNKVAASSAALLFATDVMSFNIGQIAILDAPSMMFALMTALLFMRERYALSAVTLGLAFLCKLTSIFVGAGLLAFLLLMKLKSRREFTSALSDWITVLEKLFFIGLAVGLLGLFVYDYSYDAFNKNPFEHLDFMLNYHASLTYTNASDVIFPLEWITVLPPSPYFVASVRESVDGRVTKEYHPVYYNGVQSPIWWSIWILLPLTFWITLEGLRSAGELTVDPFVLTWIAANFLPNILFAYVMGRWVYSFYFYFTVPALCVGVSHFLTQRGVPKLALVIVLLVQLFWFFYWFPVRSKVHTDLILSLGLKA